MVNYNNPNDPNVTGSSASIQWRVHMTLANRWWQWAAPIRDAITGGISDAFAWGYNLILYAQLQTRLFTATGPWLDVFAYDFLGRFLTRNGLLDGPFRVMIKSTILQERVTRAGMINILTQLTGQVPAVFEPWSPQDAGGWATTKFAYGVSGGWGSLQLPGQVFLKIRQTSAAGVPNVGGYGGATGQSNLGPYTNRFIGGAVEYVGTDTQQIGITPQLIYQVINQTRPTGVVCWTQINN
jgi:hypothetical protein